MGAETRSVTVRLSMDTAQAIAASKAYGSEMSRAMDQAEKATSRQAVAVESLADRALKGSMVLAAGVGLAGKAAVDWESQWAGVEKTVDGTASQMAALEGELRGLARTMPATHAEIAATAEAAGQLGIAREDVAAFTETMLMLGETTNLTADDAATQIAQFMNVMKTAAGDVDEIGNTLVDLGNKGASTEAEIMAMAQRLAGAGQLVGASEADVLALASAMANLGIQSELGGGAMQRVFSEIYEAAAGGEESIAGFADVAGMSAAQFADAWSTDPVAAFDAFIQGLGRIKGEGGNVVGTLRDLGLEGTQNLQVLLRLAGAGDTLTTALAQSQAAWSENSALTEEYGKRAETTAAQIQVTWNKIKDAGIEAGEALLPVMQATGTVVGTLADSFAALPDPIQQLVVGGTALAAVAGLGFAGFVKLRAAIAATRGELQGFQQFQGLRALPGVLREATTAQQQLLVAQRQSRLITAQYVGQLQSANSATARGLPRSIATQRRLADSLTQVEMAQNAARRASERAAAAEAKRGQLLRSTGQAAVRAAVPIAAMTLATTGMADSIGLSHTAQLAMVGSLAGPWGAAIGAGTGLVMDFANANDSAADALKRVEAVMAETTDIDARNAALEDAKEKLDEYKQLIDDAWGSEGFNPKAGMAWMKNSVEGLFGKSDVEEQQEKYRELQDEIEATAEAEAKSKARMVASSKAALRAQALLGGEVEATAESIDLAAGSVDELNAALSELSGLLADRSTLRAYEASLDALAEAAGQVQWDPDFAKGRENLELLDGLAATAIERSEALAKAGDSLGSVRVLQRAIRDLRDFAEKTPAARGAIRPLIRELKELTGTDARIELGVEGDKKVNAALREALENLHNFDGARPDPNLNPAHNSLESLLRVTGNVNDGLDETGRKNPRPTVRLDGAQGVISQAAQVRTELASIDRFVSIAISARHVGPTFAAVAAGVEQAAANRRSQLGRPKKRATGGPVFGPGTETSDDIPVWMSHNEHVLSAEEVRGLGGHRRVEEMRAAARAGMLGFADGGRRGPSAGIGTALAVTRPWAMSDTMEAIQRAGRLLAREYAENAKGLKGLKRATSAAEKAFDKASDRFDAVRDKHANVASNVDDLLRRSLFEDSDRSAWDGGRNTDPTSVLRDNLAEIDAFANARSTLTRKGLDGAALDGLLDQARTLDDVQAMAAMSKREVLEFERLYNARDAKLRTVSVAAGDAAWGQEMKEARRDRQAALDLQRTANRRLDAMEKHLRDAPKKTGKEVSDGVNNAAKNARRNQRRD